ncbi:MAG TPA: M20/M25/M40 family metallo-hydrolase [Opitutaceae bacterium]|nr:M20/M25/M40 family metallo-hydrolase [Opitutaceae bacterium]
MSFPRTLTGLLQELVATPSVTPGADSGGTTAGEAAMAARVAELLRTMCAEVTATEIQPGRPNVVGRFGEPSSSRPTVAIVPHLDTVGVAGMTIPPFSPELRNGRLYGRGASDTKGPMAAALWALHRHLSRAGRRDAGVNFVFAATAGEEELSVGASALCRDGFRAEFALALEPTDLRVVRAAKGVLRVWVEATGRAAHSSAPSRGRNAIFKMLPFLRDCQERLAPQFAKARHPQLSGVTLNAGVILGGAEFNVVPDRCRVALDMRTHPTLDNDAVLAEIRRAARGLGVQIHRQGPPFALPANHRWLRALAPHTRGLAAAPWFSDANILNAHHTPAVAFGPGSIRQAHTADEFIELAELEAGARAFEMFFDSISKNPPMHAAVRA